MRRCTCGPSPGHASVGPHCGSCGDRPPDGAHPPTCIHYQHPHHATHPYCRPPQNYSHDCASCAGGIAPCDAGAPRRILLNPRGARPGQCGDRPDLLNHECCWHPVPGWPCQMEDPVTGYSTPSDPLGVGARPDERALWAAVEAGERPRGAGRSLGTPDGRVRYLCRKWGMRGIYDWGVTIDIGWPTGKTPQPRVKVRGRVAQ